eukprot:311410-Pyramimonas_sp.AAC.1
MAAQPRENYEKVDCPDHCCKACRDSSDRSDDDTDLSTHDDGCLKREPLPNGPTRIAKKGCRDKAEREA